MEQSGKHCRVLRELPVFAGLRRRIRTKGFCLMLFAKCLSAFVEEGLEEQNKSVISLCLEKN